MSKIEVLVDIFDGNAWQELANTLLLLKFGTGNYQRVPDQHLGDWGIEGFTSDGEVFQCYAPDKPYTAQELYNHQRSKITTDIKKFIKNEAKLQAILPNGIKFKKWYFLTTQHHSKDLITHCQKKTEEVKRKSSHVTSDFQIITYSGNDFFVTQIPQYVSRGVSKLRLAIPPITETPPEFSNHSVSHSTVAGKLRRGGLAEGRINNEATSYIKDFLVWRSIIATIKDVSPELHDNFVERINSLEINTQRHYQLRNSLQVAELITEFEKLKQNIIQDLGNQIEITTLDYLTRGVIADWLIRCPIDF